MFTVPGVLGGLGLALPLAAALGLGDSTTGFLLFNLFTEYIPTQETLKPLLVKLFLDQRPWCCCPPR